jgi:hypothetical protein
VARIRTVKPDIRRSLRVSSWPYAVRWTFVGLPGYLDDAGRGLDDTRLIKSELYPLDDDMTAKKVDQHLDVIAGQGPLCRYEVDGGRYLHITSWREHQRINRPTPSRIPPCPLHESSVSPHVPLTDGSPPERKGKEQGKEGSASRPSAPPQDTPAEDASGVIAAFIDAATASGMDRPGKSIIGRVGRAAKQLLTDGTNLDDLLTAARRLGANGWDDLEREVRRVQADKRPTPLRAVGGQRDWRAEGRLGDWDV